MIPLRAVIRNKITGETLRWQLDCYSQKATIRQLDKSLDYFPLKGGTTKHKSVTAYNSTIIAEAFIVDRVVDGVLFRGIHALEWSNDFVIWSDVKNPNVYTILKEFVYIQYKHMTKLNRNEFDVTIPEKYNKGVSFSNNGKQVAGAVTLENLRFRKAALEFKAEPIESPTDETPVTAITEKPAKPRIIIVEKGLRYTQGQKLSANVQNKKTYGVPLVVRKTQVGGGVTELEFINPDMDFEFLRTDHQITSIITLNSAKKKSRNKAHGLRIKFVFDDEQAKTKVKNKPEVVADVPVSAAISDEVSTEAVDEKCHDDSVPHYDDNEQPTIVSKSTDENITLPFSLNSSNHICLKFFIKEIRDTASTALLQGGYIVRHFEEHRSDKVYFGLQAWDVPII